MTFYEYNCDKCDKTFEYEKNMDAPHPHVCPFCGQPGLRRIFSPLAFSITGNIDRKVAPTTPIKGTEVHPRSS